MSAVRVLVVALLVASLAITATFIFVPIYWSAYMPPECDTVAGRTHEVVVNHGYHVYVSERELARKRILDFVLLPAALAAFAAAALLNRRYRPFSNPRR
jgi:hypothetical protein